MGCSSIGGSSSTGHVPGLHDEQLPPEHEFEQLRILPSEHVLVVSGQLTYAQGSTGQDGVQLPQLVPTQGLLQLAIEPS